MVILNLRNCPHGLTHLLREVTAHQGRHPPRARWRRQTGDGNQLDGGFLGSMVGFKTIINIKLLILQGIIGNNINKHRGYTS